MTNQHQSGCSFRCGRLIAVLLTLLLMQCSRSPNQVTPASQTVELRVVSGADQTGRPGELLPEPVVVQTLRADHSGVKNVLLDARILEGSGHISNKSLYSDDDGYAQITLSAGEGLNALSISLHEEMHSVAPCTIYATGAFHYRLPQDLDDNWDIASIQDVDLDSTYITKLTEELYLEDYTFLRSLLIIKAGNLVFEEYPDGSDEYTLFTLNSATKSFIATLVGIATDQGYISGVDIPIFNHLPAYTHLKNPQNSQITLHHILIMSPGYQWSDDMMSEARQSGDIVDFLLHQPIVNQPGEKWIYNSACTWVLGAIVEDVTGMAFNDYLSAALLTPLMITNHEWENDSSIGTPAVSRGLRLRARDFARFGLLYQQGGTWNGIRIISEEWISQSVQGHIWRGSVEDAWYGYQWWVGDLEGFPFYMAFGSGGQTALIFPAEQMIVVTTTDYKIVGGVDVDLITRLLVDFILPAAG